jgi:hypothetical protein
MTLDRFAGAVTTVTCPSLDVLTETTFRNVPVGLPEVPESAVVDGLATITWPGVTLPSVATGPERVFTKNLARN